MRLASSIALALLAILLAMPHTAHAQGAAAVGWQVAVLNVVSEGANDHLAAQITQVIKAEARRNGDYHLVEQGDIALLDSLLIFGCDTPTPDCLGQLAESLEAERIIYGRLTRAGELYDIRMEIFDAMEGRVIHRWQKRFSPEVDAIGFFSKEMTQFIGGVVPIPPSRIRISSNVKGAAVSIDGKLVGRVPFMTERFEAGRYHLEVTREGYTTWRREIVLTEGDDQLFEVTLSPLDPDPITVIEGGGRRGEGEGGGGRGEGDPPPLLRARDSGGLSTYGWISVTLGGAALVGAGAASILLGQTQEDFNNTAIERRAVELRDKGRSQARTANILLGVGSVALVSGIILIAVSGDGEREGARFDAAVTPDGASVGLSAPW